MILASWLYRTLSFPSFDKFAILNLSWKTVSSNCWTYFWIYYESKFLIFDFYHFYCNLMNFSTWFHNNFRSLNFISTSANSLFGVGGFPISFWTFKYASFFYFCFCMFFYIFSSYFRASAGGQFSSISLSFMRPPSIFFIFLDKILIDSLIDSYIAGFFFYITYVKAFFN